MEMNHLCGLDSYWAFK